MTTTMSTDASDRRKKWPIGAAAFLSLMAGFVVQWTIPAFVWWHPSCDNPANRPVAYAIGFPFPHSQPSMASSMEYIGLLHILLVDVALIACLMFPLIFAVLRWLVRTGKLYLSVSIALPTGLFFFTAA